MVDTTFAISYNQAFTKPTVTVFSKPYDLVYSNYYTSVCNKQIEESVNYPTPTAKRYGAGFQ